MASVYDAGSRLTKDQQTLDGQTYAVVHAYDVPNRAEILTYPDGSTVKRVLTARGQLATVLDGTATVASRLYDNGGRLKTTTYGNNVVETRTYQPGDHQLERLVVPGVTDFAYGFDANKRKLSENDGLDLTRNQAFGYDTANRLTSWDRDGKEAQTWDLSEVGDWLSTTRTDKVTNVSHDKIPGHTLSFRPSPLDPS